MPIPGELLVDGHVIAEPNRLADHHAGQWMKHWAGEHAKKNLAKTVVEMDRLLADAREEPMVGTIDGEMVRQALYTFDDRTGQGADHTGPRFYKNLPGEGLEDLAAQINQWEKKREVACPEQLLMNIIAVLAKPVGGQRPI